jgi:hypothetical protein
MLRGSGEGFRGGTRTGRGGTCTGRVVRARAGAVRAGGGAHGGKTESSSGELVMVSQQHFPQYALMQARTCKRTHARANPCQRAHTHVWNQVCAGRCGGQRCTLRSRCASSRRAPRLILSDASRWPGRFRGPRPGLHIRPRPGFSGFFLSVWIRRSARLPVGL